MLPCADCRGIYYQLNLFPDQVFHLRMTSRGPGRETSLDDIGTWSISADGGKLTLHGSHASPQEFAIGDSTLQKLDGEPRSAHAKPPSRLVRGAALEQFEPRLTLRGMYATTAEGGVFHDCLTGQRWPVLPEAANQSLESVAAEARRGPSDAVLATVEGRVVHRPQPQGAQHESAIVVERVITVQPGEVCSPPQAPQPTLALEGPQWTLARLAGEPVKLADARRRPFLVFQAAEGRLVGSGSCNRMFGTYALTGNGLRIAGLGATKMACSDMSLETAFMDALGHVVTWRIVGKDLELADADGVVLMQFEATATP